MVAGGAVQSSAPFPTTSNHPPSERSWAPSELQSKFGLRRRLQQAASMSGGSDLGIDGTRPRW